MRVAGERLGQIPHEAAVFALPPNVVGALRQQGLGIHRGFLDAGPLTVILDRDEQLLRAGAEFEGLNGSVAAGRHNDLVSLPHHGGSRLSSLPDVAAEALPSDRIDHMRRELRLNIMPAEQSADPMVRGHQAVARRNSEHKSVAVDTRSVPATGVVDETRRNGARLARLRNCGWSQHGVMELPIVFDISRRIRQQMDAGPCGRSTAHQMCLDVADFLFQASLHGVLADPLVAGLIVHLP